MDNLTRADIKYGTVEPQLDYRFEHGRIVCYSRRIERDLDGNITLTTEWEPMSSIGYDRPMSEDEANGFIRMTRPQGKRWFPRFWKS